MESGTSPARFGGAARAADAFGVFTPLPPEGQGSSEVGRGEEIGDSTLLDLLHESSVSRGRSCREQPAGGMIA